MLIYEYEFNKCNSIYIGKTSRHLFNRVSEHKGILFCSRLQLTPPPFKAKREHIHIIQMNIKAIIYRMKDLKFWTQPVVN